MTAGEGEQELVLDEFITEENVKLEQVGAERSEQSFGLGCTLGILPIVVMIVILWIAGVLNLISVFMTLIMGSIALAGIAGLVASTAKRRAMKDLYEFQVKLNIERYLRETEIPTDEFDARAAHILPATAPLLTCRGILAVEPAGQE